MDIFEEDVEEKHVEFSVFIKKEDNWKPFKVEKCKICGKTPSVSRNMDILGKGRYQIRCCGTIINEKTETQAMYNWNLEQIDI